MKKRCFLLLAGLLIPFFTSFAQEICDNGIDDDGDTFIDIADPDCAEFYGLTFNGENADCSVDPPSGAGIDFFALGDSPIKSSQNTVDDQSKIVVGDVDNDGIPDAVATTRWGFQLSVFATTDGQDDGKDAGDEKSTFKYSNSEPIFNTSGSKITPDLEVWIADIGTFDASGNYVSDTPDGNSEIFGTGSKRVASGAYVEDYFFVAFTYQPDDLVPIYDAVYMSKTSPGPGSASGFNNFRPGIPGITDFDGDGKAEIYFRNRIYAAETGFLLADGGGDWISEINAAPVAANIIKSSQELELISGNLIYDISSVNLTNRTPGAPTAITPTLDMNAVSVTKVQSPGQPAWTTYHPRIYEDVDMAGGPDPPGPSKAPTQKFNYSSTSVADVNGDGTLDVFLSGAIDSPNGVTAVFYWDIVASQATAYEPIDPDDFSNWEWGTGRVNLRDLDGDAKVEANFVAGDHLYALEESGGILTEMWTADLKDALSGIVATTVYDFENDGRPEIVVRDSKELRMHDGITGVLVNSPPACESHTLTEGPIIVDVNGDGDTDICIACFTGPGVFKPADNTQAKLGGITLFNSTSSNWLPTRKVWNQGGYFVVNIKDDLSVPFPMGDQSTIFGAGVCDNGQPGPQRPLNMFLNQIPTLGPGGCPIFPAPDIAFGGIDPRDPDYDPNLMPGDPGYIPPTIEVIPPICGELEITVNFNITNNGSLIITDDIPVSFWAVDPTDPLVTPADRLHVEILSVIDFQIGEILQFSNIVFNSTGEAFTLYIVLNDDFATVSQAGLAPFLPLTLDDPDIQECDVNNNIYDFPITPQPFVVQTTSTPNVQCDAADPLEPENGTISAIVFEGGVETTDYAKFGFQWYVGNDTLPANAIPGPQGTKKLLEGDFSPDPGVADGLYTLVVTNLEKGCQSLPLTDTVALDELKPDIALVKIQDQSQCERPPDKSPDGIINSVITGGPLGAIWEYNWVDDNLNPYNITTQNATGLSKGIYILEVTLQGSGCIFNSEPMVLEGPEIPDPVATTVADVDNCDTPNGEVTAQALISGVPQDTLNYDFIWRESDVNFITNGTLLDPVAKNPTRKGLEPGYYVVQVIDKNTGCESAWAITQVGNLIKIPEITLSELAPQTSCDPLNPNGMIQVDIAIDGIPQPATDFTIEWFRGDNTDPMFEHTNTSGINGEIAEGVDALVFFTVQVTSAQQCSISDKLQISESKPVFAITVVTMTPNSTCDETLATSPFTGELSVDEITIDGVPTTDYTGLTFTWYEGNNILTATEIIGETSSSIIQREDMDYLVLVTQDNTTCASPEVLETITAVEDLPVILITETPETTCSGTPNGIMAAAVDVGGVPTIAGYTYEWFAGDDVLDPPVAVTSGAENQDAIELDGGFMYTVRVTNNTTGCSDVLTEFLDDLSQKPVIDNLTKVDNTICDVSIGFTGSVTAAVTDANGSGDFTNAAEYDINWFQGETTLDPPIADPDPSTPLVLEGIEGNWYTLEIVNKLLGCTSLPVKIFVEDKQPTITITFTKFPSTNCDPLNPATANGSIIAAAWADIDLDGFLDPGEDDLATFEINWYEGNGTGGTQLTEFGVDPNSEQVENIQGGAGFTYTVEVTHAPSGCVEIQFPVTLGSAPLAPTISFTTLDDSGCVVGKSTGQITTLIEFDKDQDGFLDDITNDPDYSFTYSWTGPNAYSSTKAVTIGDPTNVDPLDLGLEDGVYNLTITEATLGCTFNPLPITVDDAEIDILYEVTKTPSTNCRPNGNPDGSISIKGYYDLDNSGIGGDSPGEDDQSQFQFNLTYTGTKVPAPVTENTPSSDELEADGIDDTFNFLQGGLPGAENEYTILITHPTTGCTLSIPLPLEEVPFVPAISFTPVDNSGCIAGLFTGQISTLIEFDTDGDGTPEDISALKDPLSYDFQFEWEDALGNPLGIDNYIIGDPTNGTLPALGPGLEDGTYSVTITEQNSGCVFTPPAITIGAGQLAILYEVTKVPSTNCRPNGNPDGSISIKGYYDLDNSGIGGDSPGEDDQSQFQFNLTYTGTKVPAPVTENTPSSDELEADGIDDTFNFLQGGLPGAENEYTILITHPTTGCTLSIPLPLEEVPFVPAISFTPVDNSGCIAGLFTGQISTLIEFDTDGDGTPEDISALKDPLSYDFQFEWEDALGNPLGIDNYIIGDPTNGTLPALGPGLEDGTYSVTITEQNSGCVFTPPAITIGAGQLAILYEVTKVPSTNCRPNGNPDGSISIKGYYDLDNSGIGGDSPGEDDQSQFQFNLTYTGTKVPAPVTENTPSSDELEADGIDDTFNFLQGGLPGAENEYTILITHPTTGCTLSIPLPLEEVPFVPAISFTPVDNSGCIAGLFTGQISTLIEFDTDGDGTPEDISALKDPLSYDFQFEWEDALGNPLGIDNYIIGDPTNGTLPALGPGLEDGTYSVTITEQNSGCVFTPPAITIGAGQLAILYEVTKVPSTNCRPNGNPDGSISIKGYYDLDNSGIGGDSPGEDDQSQFQFNLTYTGTKVPAPVTENTPSSDELEADGIDDTFNFLQGGLPGAENEYTILITHPTTGCTLSIPLPLEEVPFVPAISFTPVDNSGCIAGLFTGQISTLIEFDTDGDGTPEDISALKDPLSYDFQFEWEDALGNPLGIDNYIIGDPTNGTLPALGPGLEDGTYSVTITEQNSGCVFTPPAITIGAGQLAILYEVTKVPSTNCRPNGNPDGSISIKGYYDLDNSGIGGDSPGEDDQSQFQFNLTYTGTKVPAPVTENTPSSDELEADGIDDTFNFLQGGLPGAENEYTILITHPTTGCTLSIPLPLEEVPFVPAISFTPVDNSGCIAGLFTGQISTLIEFDTDGDGTPEDISALKDPLSYDFQFEWEDALGNPLGIDNYIIGDPTNGTLPALGPGLEDGTYSVTITEQNSGCVFTPPAITIGAGQLAILYEVTKVPSTNCRPNGNPDGSISIKGYYDLDNSGIGGDSPGEDDQSQFQFNLTYTGTKVPAPVTENTPSSDELEADGIDDTFNFLQGGLPGAENEYTILITHPTTGCTLSIPLPLEEVPFVPAISFTHVENVGCEAGLFTGQISTLIEFDTDGDGTPEDISALKDPLSYDFQFEWEDALGNPLGIDNYIIGDPTNGTLPALGPGLEDGTYSVTITELNSGCVFTPPDINLLNDEQPIIISFQNIRNSSCTTPNGELLAGIEIAGVFEFDAVDLSDYEFRWYQGTGIVAPSVEILGPSINFNEVTQLAGNDFYTVRVRNILTGCENTFTEEVKKVTHKPIISISVTDYKSNISCDESIVQLEAIITNQFDSDGDGVDLFIPQTDDDFEYTWYEGPDDTGPVIVSGTFNNDGPGFSNKILYNKDGRDQAFTTPANKLTVGDYTLKVRHIDSQCESDIVFEKIEEPPILFDIVPNFVAAASDCDLKEGKIWVDVVVNGSGYIGPNAPPALQYDWYVGAPTNTVPVKYAAFVPPGGYNITTSVPTNSFYTDTEIGFGDQIGVTPGVTEDFPFEDFEGLGNPESTLSGVEAGIYTVVVTDPPTGCKEYITIEVPLQVAQQNNVVTVTHNTTCDVLNPNGEIGVNLIPDGVVWLSPTDYEIYLFDGTNPTLITDTPPATFREMQPGLVGGNNFLPLEPGVYTVASIPNAANGCWSAPSTITVSQYAFPPAFTALEFLPNTSCNPGIPDGELRINISHNPSELPLPPPAPTLYRVQALNNTTGFVDYESSPPGIYTIDIDTGLPFASEHDITGLDAVTYTVTVESDRDCPTSKDYTIDKRDIRPGVTDILDSDQFKCSNTSSDFGFAQVNEIQYQRRDGTTVTLNFGGTDFDDYVFTWYLDDGADPTSFDILSDTELTFASGTGDASALLDFNDIEYVGTGTYWVIVKNNDPAIEGLECESQPFQFIIEDKTVKPTALSAVVANTTCDPNFADGVLWIDPDRNIPAPIDPGYGTVTDWTVTFTKVSAQYAGPGPYGNGPDQIPALNVPINVNILAGLDGKWRFENLLDGEYEFYVTEDGVTGTGCDSDVFQAIIPRVEINPDIADYTRTAQFICGPDGSITITQITTTQSGSIADDGTITLIDPAVTEVIADNNFDDYYFTWYYEDPVSGSIDPITDPIVIPVLPATQGIGLNTIDNTTPFILGGFTIQSGNYYVDFRKFDTTNPPDYTGAVGCPNLPLIKVPIDIQDEKVKPMAISAVVGNTACDDAFADGVLWIDPDRNIPAPIDPGYGTVTDWTVTFTKVSAQYAGPGPYGNGPDQIPALNVPINVNILAGLDGKWRFENLLDGEYEFYVTEDGVTGTGCDSDVFQAIIPRVEINPDIADYTRTAQFICGPDGSITITQITTTQSGSIADDGTITLIDPAVTEVIADNNFDDYYFTWYYEDPVSGSIDPITDPIVIPVLPATQGIGLNTIDNTTPFILGGFTIQSGNYYVDFRKFDTTNPPDYTGAVGCPNLPLIKVPIDIQDEKVKPMAISAVVGNTACDDAFADGVLWIDPDRNIPAPIDPGYGTVTDWTVTFTKVSAQYAGPGPYGNGPDQIPALNVPINVNILAGLDGKWRFENLLDGEYEFYVTEDGVTGTGCDSDVFQAIIPRVEINPDIADYTRTAQFICGPDGSITITQITTTQSGSIADDGTITLIDPAVTEVIADNNFDDYYFTWYYEDPVSGSIDPITDPIVIPVLPATQGIGLNTIDNTTPFILGGFTIQSGNYYVDFRKFDTTNPPDYTGAVGCPNLPLIKVPIDIQDEKVKPMAISAVVGNTACDDAFADGVLWIDPDRNIPAPIDPGYGTVTDWTVTFTKVSAQYAGPGPYGNGPDQIPALNVPINVNILAGLDGKWRFENLLDGEYEFYVTEDGVTGTGCDSDVFQAIIPRVEINPDIADYTRTAQFICGPDGSITITQITTTQSGSIADDGTITLIDPAVTEVIADNNFDDYYFTWYYEDPVSGSIDPITDPIVIPVLPATQGIGLNTIDNTTPFILGGFTIQSGNYYVDFRKFDTTNPPDYTGAVGCPNLPLIKVPIDIQDEKVKPMAISAVVGNTACDDAFADGVLWIDPDRNIPAPIDPGYGTVTDWTVTFTKVSAQYAGPGPYGNGPDQIPALNVPINVNILAGLDGKWRFENLLDGEYEFYVTEDGVTGTGCDSDVFQAIIPRVEINPDIADYTRTAQFICGPDGSITITQITTTQSGSIADDGTITLIDPAVTEVIADNNFDDYYFTWYYEDPVSGSIDPITDPIVIPVLPATQGIGLNTIDNTTPFILGGFTIQSGNYYVDFRKFDTTNPPDYTGAVGCPNLPLIKVPIDIQDEKVKPMAISAVVGNTACDDAFADGVLWIDPDRNIPAPIDPGYGTVTDWTVTFTKVSAQYAGPGPYGNGPDQIPALNVPINVNILAGLDGKWRFENLLDGEYEFYVTEDGVTGTGCDSDVFQAIIPRVEINPDIADYTRTAQFICGPDGSITITQITTTQSGSIADDGTITLIDPAVTEVIADNNFDDYYFTWYYEDPVSGSIDPITDPIVIPVLPATQGIGLNTIDNTTPFILGGFTIQSGNYYVDFRKFDTTNPPDYTGAVGCPNLPLIKVPIDIQDEKVKPAFTFETTANTACNPVGADGSFIIDPNRNMAVPGNYPGWAGWTVSITKDPDPLTVEPRNLVATINAGTEDEQYTQTAQPDGIYEFTITDVATGCFVDGQLEVPKLEIFPFLDQSGYDITKQFTCNPDGSISINAIESIQSGSPAPVFTPATVSTDNDMTEYIFTWYRGTDFTTAAMVFGPDIPGGVDPLTDGNFLNVTTYPAIGEDTYWVTFTKTTAGGIQCDSSPEKFIIESDIALPVIAFSQSSSTSCAPVAPNGRLEAVITTRGLTPVGGLNFSWFVGDDITDPPFVDPTNGTIDASVAGQETLVDVAAGIYTLTVEDVATGCFTTASFEVLDAPVIPNITLDNVSLTPQDICDPSGSIVIIDADISIGGNPGFVKDFWFTWTLDNPSNTPLDSISAFDGTPTGLPIQGAVLDSDVYQNMGAGDYYVSISPKAGEGAGCPGPPRKVVVNDISTNPLIDFANTPNSACPGGTPNGTIIATVQEADGTTTDPYTYTWTVDGGPVDPLTITDVANTSTVINATDGDYTLLVDNTNTGCTFTKGFTLILDRTLSEPNIITVDKVDPLDCNPSARMEVIEIQLGGQPANVGDFEYRWYAGAFDPANLILTDPLDPLSPPVSTANLENVAVGKYFVTAIELITNCESIAKEVNILDLNIVYPTVEIFQDRPQTSCDLTNPNGQLSALADGAFDDSNSGGNYTFTWFDESLTQIGIGSTLPDLGVGVYTVEVLNTITGCTATSAFIIEDGTEFFRLQVSLSTQPVTFCDIDNGVVEARISNHNIGNWEFTWTGPNSFSTVETGNTSRLDNVEPGDYMVSAIDLDGDYCPSLVKSITVEDQRVPPLIDLIVDSQLTNCYIDQPNGQITATAGGSVTGFEFNWYNGTTVSGQVIETNNIISGLPIGSYTVEIIDRFTKCAVSDFRNIEDATVVPPTPAANILNNLTDCLNPDGSLEAVYTGNLNDYDFFWYNGNSPSGTPANEETTYNDLDLGEYTLTVMDLKTGCVSEGLTVPIIDERVYPEFTTKVTNANCETSNGIIELQFDTNYGVREVLWYDQSGFNVGAGQILIDQPTGDYTFDIVTFKNCEASGAETIGTEITNYNGISANGDGSNEDFQIDCITLFPNNNVKIFNRAGIKIYEADGYNNDDVVFNGIGLNGIYLSSQDLPDGTYFYVIDKGDGSRPVTGYLELIR